MSKYGTSRYGSGFKYGEVSTISVYYNSGIVANLIDYNSISISWSRFSYDPADGAPTYWKLVKSYSGSLDNPDDATMLAGGAYSNFSVNYVDTLKDYVGKEINYSLWVFNGLKWIACGNSYVINAVDEGSLTKVTKWIPRAWLNSDDSAIGDVTGEPNSGDFLNFLSAFVLKYDVFRSQANLLTKSMDKTYAPSSLLKYKIMDFGFDYEPVLGDAYHRSLTGVSNVISAYKGTTTGISSYATGLTHWPSKIYRGHNLMLDYNDSSFEESIGRWVASSGTFVSVAYPIIATVTAASAAGGTVTYTANNNYTAGQTVNISGLSTAAFNLSGVTIATASSTQFTVTNAATGTAVTGATGSATITSFNPPSISVVLYDPITKPRLLGLGQLTTAATTPVTLTLPGTSDITLNGIVVSPNTRYVFSGWVLHRDSNAATVTAVISWYNVFGTLISTTATPTALTTTTSWQEFTSKSDSGRNGIKSPANAAFAKVVLTVTPSSATSSRFAFDLFQFAEYTRSFEFQDAKRIQLTVSGDRVNYIPNGSFEAGLGSWSAYNGGLSLDPTTNLGVTFGKSDTPETSSALLTASGSAPAYISDWFPLPASGTVTASAYVMGSAARQATLAIEFSSQATDSAQTSVVNDATYGQYYPITPNVNLSQFNPTTITNITSDGTTVTFTAANSFIVGQNVVVTGVTPTTFNITGTVATASSTQFTVTNSALDLYVEGGSAYVTSTTLSTTVGTIITNTVVVPPYTRDAGYPMAKITVYFPNGVTNDKFWLDGVLVTDGTSAKPFFGGTGGVIPSDPTTSTYYSVNDTKWEIRNKYNFASNPSFEDGTLGSLPTDWTGTGFTKVATDGALTSLYNAYFGKLSFTTTGTITGNYYLPYPAFGGEDITISAYVRNVTGTYTIAGSTFAVASANASRWTRIYGTIQLAAGVTNGTFTISVSATGASVAHVDGVQVEYGRIVSRFVDPLDTAGTTVFVNPINTAKKFVAAQSESNGGGNSTWFYNYSVKANRLNVSGGNYTMQGTTWALKTGYPTESYRDLTESLIPSNSFEKDLGTWVASSNATLTRKVSKGYYLSDTVTQGQAYCTVAFTPLNDATAYSITSDKIYISPDGGYYASAAIRPSNANSTGDTYTLRVDFYDGNNTLIPVYTDNLTGQLTTNKYDGGYASNGSAIPPALNTAANLTTIRSASITPALTDRWFYVAKTFTAGSIQGAVYAILSVTCTHASSASAKAFDIDRIVFRR
jgi:hypothetical protein